MLQYSTLLACSTKVFLKCWLIPGWGEGRGGGGGRRGGGVRLIPLRVCEVIFFHYDEDEEPAVLSR